jgi:hypothetical protein
VGKKGNVGMVNVTAYIQPEKRKRFKMKLLEDDVSTTDALNRFIDLYLAGKIKAK